MPIGFAKKNNKKAATKSKEAETTTDTNIKQKTNDETDNTESFLTEGNSKLIRPEEQLLSSSSTASVIDDGDISIIKADEEIQDNDSPTIDHRSELEILMEDVRESLKEKSLIDSSSQVLPGSAYQKNKKIPKVFQKLDDWLSEKVGVPFLPSGHVVGAKRKRSPIRIMIIILSMVCLVYLLVIATNYYLEAAPPPEIPTPTPVPTYSIPTPFSIQFPGGWIFLLNTSQVVYPDWKPTQAEWLNGTEICKLIAIPWTKQIDAVYKTLIKGDKITLTMSNQDKFLYQIESLEKVSKENLIKMVNSNSPCMVIFLYKDGSTISQVLTSVPSAP
jgi:hypothetical protein